jgi:hypothetical protein
MDAGELVPDDGTVAMVRERLTAQRGGGFILDGFPRTVEQARALNAIVAAAASAAHRPLPVVACGAIAGHGGLLKLIIRADDRTLLGVHCFGDAASEVVNLGHVVVQGGGRVESFLTLALNTPTYTYAYHDAALDGLTQLSRMMGLADGEAPALRHRE